jgi:hypothetical protein
VEAGWVRGIARGGGRFLVGGFFEDEEEWEWEWEWEWEERIDPETPCRDGSDL